MEKFVALALLFLGFQAQAFASAVVVTDNNGTLTGVDNLLVKDGSYSAIFNVSILDGTCISLYNGCDSIGDFNPSLLPHATAGFLALGSAISAYLTSPQLIRGCTSSYFRCYIETPNSVNVGSGEVNVNGFVVDWSGDSNLESESPGGLRTTDLATLDSLTYAATYAVWTPVSPVPLPATGWLLVSAVAMLGWLGVRRRAFSSRLQLGSCT